MMSPACRYRCRCGADKVVPEQPLDPTPSIRTGCDECGSLQTHKPVGSVFGWGGLA